MGLERFIGVYSHLIDLEVISDSNIESRIFLSRIL
jgi:hypothetical protein